MRHRSIIPVMLALIVLAGYGFASRTVEAQAGFLPFDVGETVVVYFADDGSRECRIDEIKGVWVKCGNPSDRRGITIGRTEPPELWINFTVVESITKAAARR